MKNSEVAVHSSLTDEEIVVLKKFEYILQPEILQKHFVTVVFLYRTFIC